MQFSEFFHPVKDKFCAELFNRFKIELEKRDFRKSLHFYIVDAGKKNKNRLRLGALY